MQNISRYSLLFILSIAVWAYYPSLGGGFIFDDDHNISTNELLKIDSLSLDALKQASMSRNSGPLRRPLAMLSFAINHVFTGMNTWWMKVTNLSIHLFNGVLVLLLTKCLYRRYSERNATPSLLPYYLTAIWLIHPINVTAVSYIVQRMTSLSATFVLLAIYCYLLVRESTVVNGRRIVLSFSILFFWLLGMLTKETAILLSIYIFVIEWCVYGFRTESTGERRHLLVVWVLLAIPWIGALFYSLYDSSFLLDGYRLREFSASERMYTELRVVMDYFRYMIIPDIRYMGLYHDNIVISKSLFSPMTSLLSMLTIAGLLGLALRVRNTAPLFCLGILWFFGGHVLESTIYPLEIKFFHRNYLPSIGLIIAAAEFARFLYVRYRRYMLSCALIILLGFSISTRSLNHQWSADFRMQLMEAINNPESVRANFRAGEIAKFYAIYTTDRKEQDEHIKLSIKFFKKIRSLSPRDISGEMGILETYFQAQREVPRETITQLLEDLPEAKVEEGMLLVFESYKDCYKEIEKGCLLLPEDFEKIKDALLMNPELVGANKSRVLQIYAEFLGEHMGDYKAAIATQVNAVTIFPIQRNFMLLSGYYEKVGYYRQVNRTIDMMEYLDEFGASEKFIRETRERIGDRDFDSEFEAE